MTNRRPSIPAFHPERHRSSASAPGCAGEGGPTGCVSIGGTFALTHHDEIMDVVRRFEERENAGYPEKRIIAVRAAGDNLMIDTNDVRLARAIGETLKRNYQGELKFHFGDADCLVRVHWER